jgi:RNA polymerase sigma-70 factor (ECF subfamily)
MTMDPTEHAGDDQQPLTFDLLAQQHYRPTLLMAYRMLGDWHEAEDLAQETLLKVFLHFDRLRNPAALGAWLRRVTRNGALDILAARRRRPATVSLTLGDEGEPPWFTTLVADSVEAEAARAEFWQALRAGLDQLESGKSAALVLHDVYGYTCDEIAGQLAIGLSATKMRIARARQQMRQVLQEQA